LKFGEMEFSEMKRNTSNWSNFCMLLRRAGLTASAGLSCSSQLSMSRNTAPCAPRTPRFEYTCKAGNWTRGLHGNGDGGETAVTGLHSR